MILRQESHRLFVVAFRIRLRLDLPQLAGHPRGLMVLRLVLSVTSVWSSERTDCSMTVSPGYINAEPLSDVAQRSPVDPFGPKVPKCRATFIKETAANIGAG